MNAARTVQWILLGLASVGCIVLVTVFAGMAYDLPGDESPAADSGWSEVLSAVPEAGEPADYQDGIIFDGSLEPGPEEKAFFSRSNRFMGSSGVFMLLGLVSYGFVIAASARRRSGRFAPLAVLGTGGVILGSYWLFGFNTSYPGDFAMGGLLPARLGGPVLPDDALDDIYAYGLAFTMWTDFFYQAAFAMSSGVFVTGLLAGHFRTPLVVCAAIAAGSLGFPIAVSWLWGAGWLLNLGAYDFAGAGPVHLLAGGTGLALVLLARVCPPLAPWQMHTMRSGSSLSRALPRMRMGPGWLAVFWLAAAGFLLLPLGMQAGSVLALDTPVVASVLHNTVLCLGGAITTAGLVSIPLALRPRAVILFVAGLAGLAAICGPADLLHGHQAAILGVVVGAVSAVLLWTLDRFGFDDPLGLVAAHLAGGLIGMVVAGLASPDTPLPVQLVASVSFATLGLTIGACTGLLGWLTGLLWTPGTPSAPPALPEAGPHPDS